MSTWRCLYCNKEHESRGPQYADKYCSNLCQSEYQHLKRLEEWREGVKFPKGSVKRYLSEKRAGCWECSLTSWRGNEIILELEHNDGDSSNNTEENLSLLCPNCHSQTPTYKGRNRGNGRHARRERYKSGKSY